jgi:peptidoglycan/LPS O-acetylase OafA/YrhL
MIGYLRMALALIIVAGHAGAIPIAPARWAVWVFYALAGYFGAASTKRGLIYWRSRYLRIWPSWAVVFLVTAIALPTPLLLPRQWLQQLFLVFAADPNLHPLVVPQGWMLPILLAGWALIAVGAGDTMHRAIAWATLAAALMAEGLPGVAQLWAIGLLFFALGAVAYHGGLSVPRDGRWAAMAGALSFPVYLVHFGVITALPVPRGWPMFWAALLPTLALSVLLWRFVEIPVDKLRKAL